MGYLPIIQDSVPRKLAELLVIQEPDVHQKLVTYILGQARIFTEAINPLSTNMAKVTVRYWTEADLNRLIGENTSMRFYRVISSCHYPSITGEPHKWTPTSSQFLEEAARQTLAQLRSGATLRIDSSNKLLRDAFYRAALKLNEQHKFGINFDYNDYDARLVLRQIYTPGTKKKQDYYSIFIHFDKLLPTTILRPQF